MTEHLSYIEDHPKHTHLAHPQEFDIISPVAANDIGHIALAALNVCRRCDKGIEIHGDFRPNPEGIPVSPLLFHDNHNDNYLTESTHPPMAAVPNRQGAFQDITEVQGDPRRDVIHVSDDGKELDLERYSSTKAHRPQHFHYLLQPAPKPGLAA